MIDDLDGGIGDSCTFSRTYETYYLRAGGKLLAEYPHPDSLPDFLFIYAGDQRIAMYDKYGRLHFYLNDHLGSARVVMDSAGTVKDRYEYYSYGDNLDRSLSTGQAHQYTGQELDMDGGLQVYYYGQRYYDDNLGMFQSIDPLPKEYPAWSPYVYTLDNPMRYVDPEGEAVEIFWDAFNLTLDVKFLAEDFEEGDWWGFAGDILGLAADGLATALPFVPAGVGAIRQGARAAKVADAAIDAARAVDAAAAGGKAVRYFESFDALKATLGPAGEGMQWHHIVEQSQVGRFGAHAIHNTENVVAVGKDLNIALNAFYSSRREFITGSTTMTVREWLGTKTYDEAREFGLMALEKVSAGEW